MSAPISITAGWRWFVRRPCWFRYGVGAFAVFELHKQGHSLLKSWLRPSASDCGAVRTTPCCLRDRLERMVAANRSTFKSSNFAAPFPGGDVRLYWWFRFDGARRSAKRPHAVKCEGGFQCVIDSRDESFSRADAIVVFVGARPERHCLPPRLPQQLWIVEYGESPAYYPELWSPAFMSQFNLKVSHEYDSDVILTTGIHPLVEGGVIPPALWPRQAHAAAAATASEPRASAIVWLASNCDSRNRREELVRRLQSSLPSSLPLHSVGRCLHNHDDTSLVKPTGSWSGSHDAPWVVSKLSLFLRYSFCLVLENSIATDYISEKLFHAFAGGCLPIYYGTRDVYKVLPHPLSIIHVLDYPSVDALVKALVQLASRPEELRARLAWRDDSRAVDAWWAGLRNRTSAETTATKRQHFCSVCEAVRRMRAGHDVSRPLRRLRPSRKPELSVWPPLGRELGLVEDEHG